MSPVYTRAKIHLAYITGGYFVTLKDAQIIDTYTQHLDWILRQDVF